MAGLLADVVGPFQSHAVWPVAGPISVFPTGIYRVWMGRIESLLPVAENGQHRCRVLLFQLVVTRSKLAFDLFQRLHLGLGPAVLEFLAKVPHSGDNHVLTE